MPRLPSRRRALLPRRAAAPLALASLGVLLAATVSCHEEMDTTRDPGPQATFGDDVYSMFCDRLGASAIPEDLEGASYRSICHHDERGRYGDEVDESLLPPPSSAEAKKARALSVAKLHRLAEHRSLLVKSFNQVFPDVMIPDPTTEDEDDEIRLLDGFKDLGTRMIPLYEGNPYDEGGEALAPSTTRALGRLFDALAEDEDARAALQQMAGRQGYRPFNVGLGAIRSFMTYPDLRNLTKTALQVFGPDGHASPTLQHMLDVGKREMLTARTVVSPLPQLVVDPATGTPNRPRQTSEVVASLMLAEHPSFAPTFDAPPRYITVRDKRGFAVPAGSSPGIPGTVPAPFADVDLDGFADVDARGRFIDGAGDPLEVDTPFILAGRRSDAVDAFGRPSTPTYQYIDTSRTLAASLVRDVVPLIDPTRYAAEDDPEPWRTENETVMYALEGAYALFGGREAASYDFENDAVLPPGADCDTCLEYERFRGEDSPLADVTHAFGQILADPDSDAVLLSMIDLLENHEQKVARLVGAALRVKAIADEHDQRAAAGEVLPAGLARENPIWDQMAEVLGRIAEEPGLTTNVLGVLASDALVTPTEGSQHVGEAVAVMASHVDEFTYQPGNLNGPPVNVTVGPSSLSDPVTPVQWAAPRSGANRSILQRVMQVIADTRGTRTCNKDGAKVVASLGITVEWPLTGGYGPCELFQIDDLALFYLRSMLPPEHEKRTEFDLKDNVLLDIMDYANTFVSADQMFEDSSGIEGMTLHPTSEALTRLVFFGARSERFPNMPDLDLANLGGKTDEFVHKLMEPIGTGVCPTDGNGLPQCTQDDLLRMRNRASLFALEKRGMGAYLKPLVRTFANVGCTGDGSGCNVAEQRGEDLFMDVLQILHSHWNGPDHGPECSEQAPKGDPRHCTGAGLNRYEPIVDRALRTDLIPALHEFAKAAHDVQRITIQRGPRAGQTVGGAEILEHVTKILFSQEYARRLQLADRSGNRTTTWADGTPQDQVTVFTLITDALNRFDRAFDAEESADRKGPWKRARSQLVDAFLAVDLDGPSARFRNPSFAPMTLSALKVVREQLNANCPERESGVECRWAKWDLGQKLAQTLSGPLFASIVDTTEAIRIDEEARRELQRALTFTLVSASEDDALQGTLASMSDLLQVLADDERLAPVLKAASVAASPDADPEGAGCADRTIAVLKALVDDEYDRYHVMDVALPNLVRPLTDDDGKVIGASPLEIIMDAVADVHRIDASSDAPNRAEDYEAIMGTVRDFLVDDTRGFEQFYTIIRERPRP